MNSHTNLQIDHDVECPGCGSLASDRPGDDKQLRACPHCEALKCHLCDMGDDVECISCGDFE